MSLKHFISNDHSAVRIWREEDICGAKGRGTINDFSHDSEPCGWGTAVLVELCLDLCDKKETQMEKTTSLAYSISGSFYMAMNSYETSHILSVVSSRLMDPSL